MKLLFTAVLLASTFIGQTATVKLKLLYRNNPLCFWEVSLKHGDAVIGKAKSDENGEVSFSSVNLLSKSVDASGYKKTSNGEKKWDVKGYIALDDNNSATVNFEQIIEQTGAPASMMEAAWGLTLNDCNPSQASSNKNSGSGTTTNNSTGNDPKKEEADEPSHEEKMAEMKREREQNQADYAAQQAQQKQALEQKLQRLNRKVEEAKADRDKQSPGTVEHSDASYEVRDLEIDRELTQLKLDKMNDQQASNTGLLSKSERQRYSEKTDALEEEQKQLRKNKKEKILFGQENTASTTKSDVKEEKSDVRTEEKSSKEEKSDKKEKDDDEDDAPFKIYTPEELANMSTFDLKKTKIGNNNSIAKRKTKLKVKAAFYDQAKKAQMQGEIDALTKQVEAIKVVLAQRNEKEDPTEETK